jgi:adenosylmethionine-8-amino-7-oxononanoate aminotransferase
MGVKSAPSPSPAELASTQRWVLTRAEGLYVWDSEGRRYLDATSGAFCVQLGYTRPDLVRAMAEAASRLPHARPSQFDSEESAAYKRELLGAAGAPYSRAILTSSGSEAVEVALKIAYRYQRAVGHPERKATRYLRGHYHGATLGALGVTGWGMRRAPYEGLVGLSTGAAPGPDVGPAGGAGPVSESSVEPVAAMILETIPAAGLGAVVPPLGFLSRVRAQCDEAGALWIADEVLTGFGRVGALFAWQRLRERHAPNGSTPDSGARPDVVVFGKGAGAGFAPLAGVLVTNKVAEALDADGFTHFQTYGGNPIACAVGRRVLRAMAEERIEASVQAAEPWLEDALRPVSGLSSVRQLRGIGYLWGIELTEDRRGGPFPRKQRVAERVAEACRDRGVLVHAGAASADGERSDFILIAPPLVTPKGDFGTIAGAVADSIQSSLLAGKEHKTKKEAHRG